MAASNVSEPGAPICVVLSFGIAGIYVVYRRKAALGRDLEATVADKTADLSRRNAELARFNHVLAHDLKEPLRSIVSFSQLAARRNEDDTVGEYLKYAAASARQLDQLVTGMLGFQAEPDVTRVEAHLRDIAEDALQQIRRETPRKEIKLTAVDLPEALELPREVLAEALSIVFSNAATFNEHEFVEITLQYVRVGGRHVLTVGDNGIGIEEAYHESVFEIFKRLHVREAYPGAGIGLSRLRRILVAVGGGAEITSSSLGFGTTVALSWREPRRRRLRTITEHVTYRGLSYEQTRVVADLPDDGPVAIASIPSGVPSASVPDGRPREGYTRLRYRGSWVDVPTE